MDEARKFYTDKKNEYSAGLKSMSKKIKRFGWYRLSAFLLIFAPFVLWGWEGWHTFALSFFFLVILLVLVGKNLQLDKKKNEFEVLLKLVNDELLALDHHFSHFRDGNDFMDRAHSYSFDLDIFGTGSVFQFINRTSTQSGQKKLADWLRNPASQKDVIKKRQDAIRELSMIPDWRLEFLAKGHLFEETLELSNEIHDWSVTQLDLKRPLLIKGSIFLVPLLTLLAFIPALTGGTSLFLFVMLLLQWFILVFSGKRVRKYFQFFGRKSSLLAKYMQLLEHVENTCFKSPLLIESQNIILKPFRASYVFNKLTRYVNQFEYRKNLIVALILNSLFLWDIRCVYRLWNWHNVNRKRLSDWLGVIAEIDALISIANMAYNYPGFVYPEIYNGDFKLDAVKMGHPLLFPGKRVDNDLNISGWSKVMIITGANMAGKSTFLRTVGVNLVLAGIGAPVCAEKMTFTPVEVYTDMRTTDSLLKDESYFFAELKRIKGVLDRLKQGEHIFVILDEMLKGTNSLDKLNGSRELIRKLIDYKAVAVIATHDMKISEMESEYPQMVLNKCFEIRIEDDEMIFDYKLTDGVTRSMNATYLMKKMGII